jgi:hypothetical protein
MPRTYEICGIEGSMRGRDYMYTNPKLTSMSPQNLKPNGHEMVENWPSARLGTSIPTAKSGNT